MVGSPHPFPTLQGRPWEIALTVEREIRQVAPYAELRMALDAPTWYFHEKVVALVPLSTCCQLHFWQGDALEGLHPGLVRPMMASGIRTLKVTSMLDIDESVRALFRAAFQAKIEQLAADDHTSARKAAFPL